MNKPIYVGVAIIDLSKINFETCSSINTILFEAPYNSLNSLDEKYKSQAFWLSRNDHGLLWNDGYVPYTRVITLCCSNSHLRQYSLCGSNFAAVILLCGSGSNFAEL